MSQVLKFALTGGLATSLQYLILALGLYAFHLSAGLASGIGYLAGSILSYIVNYVFTFRSQARHCKALIQFYGMVAMAWLINTMIVFFAADLSGLNPWISQFAATGLVFIFNFWVSRNWVFKND